MSEKNSTETRKLHAIWENMIRRCHDPRRPHFDRYGGRGIVVCDRWRNSFDGFCQDMGPRPSEHHQVDRVDNDGNYEPRNCRWATIKEQARNRRNLHMVTYQGETRCVAEWAEIAGIPQGMLLRRLKHATKIEDAFMPPPRPLPKRKRPSDTRHKNKVASLSDVERRRIEAMITEKHKLGWFDKQLAEHTGLHRKVIGLIRRDMGLSKHEGWKGRAVHKGGVQKSVKSLTRPSWVASNLGARSVEVRSD
jgi:hypothetical protein